jgi:hypothetical protein
MGDLSNWIAAVLGGLALLATVSLTIVAARYEGRIERLSREIELLKLRIGGGSDEIKCVQEAIKEVGEILEHQLVVTDNILAAVVFGLTESDAAKRARTADVLNERTSESRFEISRRLVLLDGVTVQDLSEFQTWLGRCLGALDKKIVSDFAQRVLVLLNEEDCKAAAKHLQKATRPQRLAFRRLRN